MLFSALRGTSPTRELMPALTLAALAIPEQLATAQLAGLPPAQGIAVFAVASVVMAMVARSRVLSVGADSTTAPVIAAAVIATAPRSIAPLIAGLVGIILCAIALLRLEWVARLLSKPVAAGMMAGISLHILIGRLPTALGLNLPAGSIVETLVALSGQLGGARIGPLLMTVSVVSICAGLSAVNRRLPAALFALALVTLLAAVIDPQATLFPRLAAGDGLFGLTRFSLHPGLLLTLLPAAISVAFLCLFQTTVVLREIGEDNPTLRRNALGSLGIANLAAAAIGGFACNSSPPRTEILRDCGAQSQWASVGAAALGLAAVWYAPGVLRLFPAAALAGVLAFIAIRIFPARDFRILLRTSRVETVIAIFSLSLVVALPLQVSLPIAILLSLAHAAAPLMLPQVSELHQVPGTTVWWQVPASGTELAHSNVLVLGVTAPINFANAEGIVTDIQTAIAARPQLPKLVVLECAGVLRVDVTGAESLRNLVANLRAAGIGVALARVESEYARRDLERGNVLEELGRSNVYQTVNEAVRSFIG